MAPGTRRRASVRDSFQGFGEDAIDESVVVTLDSTALTAAAKEFAVAAADVVGAYGRKAYTILVQQYFYNLVSVVSPSVSMALASMSVTSSWCVVSGNLVTDLITHLCKAGVPSVPGLPPYHLHPELAASLLMLLRSVLLHVLWEDLAAQRMALEKDAAQTLTLCEDNLHELYRRAVVQMEVSRSMARFMDEKLDVRAVAVVAAVCCACSGCSDVAACSVLCRKRYRSASFRTFAMSL
jgi:hypothetical protein